MDLGLNIHNCEGCSSSNHCALEIAVRYFKEHQEEYVLLHTKMKSEWYKKWENTFQIDMLTQTTNPKDLSSLSISSALMTGWALAKGAEYIPTDSGIESLIKKLVDAIRTAETNELVRCARCHWFGKVSALKQYDINGVAICPSCLTSDRLEYEHDMKDS